MNAALQRECPGCAVSRSRQRCTCLWCGNALEAGRIATDDERYATSAAGRQARVDLSMAARRDLDAIDAVVLAAIGQRFARGAVFTHSDLVGSTGLNPCALKHALERLLHRGLIEPAGILRVRAARYRSQWRLARGGHRD